MKFDNDKIKDVFVDRLNSLMIKGGYQKDSELLNKLDGGISQSRFSDLKNGKTTPSLKDLIIISDHFNVSIEYLISDIENINDDSKTAISALENITDSQLFMLLMQLESKGKLSFEEGCKFNENFSYIPNGKIAVNFNSELLQKALRKWNDYEWKFANDTGEYVKDLMLTIMKGLLKEIQEDEYNIEGVPFN